MLNSVLEDLKYTLRSGNMISRIIIINIIIYVLINLLKIFGMGSGTAFFDIVRNGLSLPSDPSSLIKQPWSLVTHMFLHVGFWHIFWNMLLLYWFGRIVGDLLGDKKILPIYIISGIFGGIVYILSDWFFPGGSGGNAYALGASAAVMAILWTAASTSPDYLINLILLGPVRIKYVALALTFFDLISTTGNVNTGGHWAHLGGALWGMLFVYLLRRGVDMTEMFQFNFLKTKPKRIKTSRDKFNVVHKSDKKENNSGSSTVSELDRILEKIKDSGYDSLSPEEKEYLYQESKKK